jgi:hypothetical protein
MERYEMAELLSQKAHVSLEQARQALEENNWDMLDAMVALERQQNRPDPTVTVAADGGETTYTDAGYTQPVKNVAKKDPVFTNGFSQIWKYLKRLGKLSVDNDFVVIRKDKILLSMPVLVLLILLLCSFGFILFVLVAGLFLGCQYRFEGKASVKNAMNKAMKKLDDVADHIKEALNEEDEEN